MKTKNIYLLLVLSLILLTSCSSYNYLSKYNKFSIEESYTSFYNKRIQLKSLTFGDFKFASNNKAFAKLTGHKKPAFKNILLYAKTLNHPGYEYYLLLNAPSINHPDFFIKDTVIRNSKITLAISKQAPGADIEFISSKIVTF